MKKSLVALVVLAGLALLGAGSYFQFDSVQVAVNERAPWVAALLRSESPSQPDKTAGLPPEATVIKSTPAPAPLDEKAASPAAPVRGPGGFDLRKLARNRTAWPAHVKLVKATEFPEVVDGSVVGSRTAPAGTEVGLVTISGGKLAVEYQGGGAWVFPEETDVAARTQRVQE